MNDTEHYWTARAAAGRAAVGLADGYEHDVTVETLSGLTAGFVLALSELQGWDATLSHLYEIARHARTPVDRQTPKLHIVEVA